MEEVPQFECLIRNGGADVFVVRDLKGAIEVVRREGIAIEDAPDLVEGQAVALCAVAPGDGIFDQAVGVPCRPDYLDIVNVGYREAAEIVRLGLCPFTDDQNLGPGRELGAFIPAATGRTVPRTIRGHELTSAP